MNYSKRIIFLSGLGGLFFFLMVSCNTAKEGNAMNTTLTDTVKIEPGLISGLKTSDGVVHIYKGIPFAAPPVGDLRWKAPQPVKAWDGIKKCDKFSASAIQTDPVPFGVYTEEFLAPRSPLSEDCLYLNVWTAAKSNTERRPVIVWIHGGGFVSGSGSVPIYNGESMARKGIVFVTINYRLGIFGFFAHPELTAESEHHASGNYGLLDQVAALQWVKNNIASFGGDPGNVTIDGQSAGSMSVNCLVASPLAKDLFQHAIAESGASILPGMLGLVNLKEAEQKGVQFAESMKATSLADLRNLPDSILVKKTGMFRSPIIDGYFLPESIADIYKAGHQNDVPVITGWNLDDGFIMGPVQKASAYKIRAEKQYGKEAGTFLKLYPAKSDAEVAASQQAFARDNMFGIQGYAWANAQVETGKSPIYLYFFTRKLPATPEYEKYGAFHSGEIVYALDNLPFLHRPWEHVDYDLAELMSSYWVNFAKTGNPNGDKLPDWPAYNKKDSPCMIIGVQSGSAKLPDKNNLDFLMKDRK